MAEFAFVNKAQAKEAASVEEFIGSADGDTPKSRGRPKGSGRRAMGGKAKANSTAIGVYVSYDEKKEIEKRALEHHMTVSTYVRFKIFNG